MSPGGLGPGLRGRMQGLKDLPEGTRMFLGRKSRRRVPGTPAGAARIGAFENRFARRCRDRAGPSVSPTSRSAGSGERLGERSGHGHGTSRESAKSMVQLDESLAREMARRGDPLGPADRPGRRGSRGSGRVRPHHQQRGIPVVQVPTTLVSQVDSRLRRQDQGWTCPRARTTSAHSTRRRP